VLYSVLQNSMEQLCQHIAVGCYNSMVEYFPCKKTAEGSNPSNKFKNAKTDTVIDEEHLILEWQHNQVGRNPQGEICL